MREDAVVCNDITIHYRYCHSRRGTLGITIRPDKSVTVRAPLRTSLHTIRDFVAGRAVWITKVWEKFDGQIPLLEQSYANGAAFLFQGAEYRLILEHGSRELVHLGSGLLVVTVPGESSPEFPRRVVDAWYLERAKKVFMERMLECWRLMPPGTALPPLVIRSMKSRWGSYSYRTRRITLNLNLIKLPQKCLDYVIIHELCHITVRHHGPGFWRLVGQYFPDYAEARRRLKGGGLSLQ